MAKEQLLPSIYLLEDPVAKAQAVDKWVADHFKIDFLERVLFREKDWPQEFVQKHVDILNKIPFYDFEEVLFLHQTQQAQVKPLLSPLEGGEAGVYSFCFRTDLPNNQLVTKLARGKYFSPELSLDLVTKVGYKPKPGNEDERTSTQVSHRLINPINPILGVALSRIPNLVLSHASATKIAYNACPELVAPVFCIWTYNDSPIGYAVTYCQGESCDFHEVRDKVSPKTNDQLEEAVETLTNLGVRPDMGTGNKNFIVDSQGQVRMIDFLLQYGKY